jgi:hypothetical protein
MQLSPQGKLLPQTSTTMDEAMKKEKILVRILWVNIETSCAHGMLANGDTVYVPQRGGKVLGLGKGGEIIFTNFYARYDLDEGDEIWAELVPGRDGKENWKAWSWATQKAWNEAAELARKKGVV